MVYEERLQLVFQYSAKECACYHGFFCFLGVDIVAERLGDGLNSVNCNLNGSLYFLVKFWIVLGNEFRQGVVVDAAIARSVVGIADRVDVVSCC